MKAILDELGLARTISLGLVATNARLVFYVSAVIDIVPVDVYEPFRDQDDFAPWSAIF